MFQSKPLGTSRARKCESSSPRKREIKFEVVDADKTKKRKTGGSGTSAASCCHKVDERSPVPKSDRHAEAEVYSNFFTTYYFAQIFFMLFSLHIQA